MLDLSMAVGMAFIGGLAGFYEGKKIILTNTYRKKGQKVDKRELIRAISLKKDYELRVKGRIYYE